MQPGQVELLLRRPGHPERRVALEPGAYTLGRAEDNDIVLADAGVSRRHARIVVGHEVIVEDTGSGNGTWLGTRRITRYVASDGDEIGVEPFVIVVRILSAEEHPDTGIVDAGATMQLAPPAAPPVPDAARLVLVSAHELRSREVSLEGAEPVTLGRAEGCSVVLPEPAASRVHAELSRTPQGWTVRDRNSANGTWVNGKRVRDAVLADNDLVRIGTVEFRFEARGGHGENTEPFDLNGAPVVPSVPPSRAQATMPDLGPAKRAELVAEAPRSRTSATLPDAVVPPAPVAAPPPPVTPPAAPGRGPAPAPVAGPFGGGAPAPVAAPPPPVTPPAAPGRGPAPAPVAGPFGGGAPAPVAAPPPPMTPPAAPGRGPAPAPVAAPPPPMTPPATPGRGPAPSPVAGPFGGASAVAAPPPPMTPPAAPGRGPAPSPVAAPPPPMTPPAAPGRGPAPSPVAGPFGGASAVAVPTRVAAPPPPMTPPAAPGRGPAPAPVAGPFGGGAPAPVAAPAAPGREPAPSPVAAPPPPMTPPAAPGRGPAPSPVAGPFGGGAPAPVAAPPPSMTPPAAPGRGPAPFVGAPPPATLPSAPSAPAPVPPASPPRPVLAPASVALANEDTNVDEIAVDVARVKARAVRFGSAGAGGGGFLSRRINQVTLGTALLVVLMLGFKAVRDAGSTSTSTVVDPEGATVNGSAAAPPTGLSSAGSGAAPIDPALAEDVRVQMAAGMKAFAEGRYVEATGAFYKATSLDPTSADARRMGYVACEALVLDTMRTGMVARNASEAERTSAKSAALAAVDAFARGSGDADTARSALEKALGLNANDTELLEAQERLGDRIAASAQAAGVRREEKRRASLADLVAAGKREFDKGNYGKAVAQWQQVLEGDATRATPEYYEAEEQIRLAKDRARADSKRAWSEGMSAFKAGDMLTARARLREVVRIDPFNDTASQKLTEAQSRLREQASALFKEARVLEEEANQPEKALALYQRVLNYVDNADDALYQKADARMKSILR